MDLGYLLIGWVLGLLSPFLTGHISKRLNRRQVKQAIAVEFKGLQKTALFVSYKAIVRYGNYDRCFLSWFVNMVEKYGPPEFPANEIDAIRELSTLNDEVLKVTANRLRESLPGGLALKTFEAPYTQSRLDQLQHFDESFSQHLLAIVADLSIYNQMVQDAKTFFQMTFDSSLTDSNRNIVDKNLDLHYQHVGDKAQDIVRKIDGFLSEKCS